MAGNEIINLGRQCHILSAADTVTNRLGSPVICAQNRLRFFLNPYAYSEANLNRHIN